MPPPVASPLGEILARFTREGELYEKLPGDRLRCFACGHRCLIPAGQLGICKVRYNEAGTLRVPYGYVGALQVDPVEKKPFFHALPGSLAFSFGMLGCDLHCGYCFTGETMVATENGPTSFETLFAASGRTESRPDAELAYPEACRVIAASGASRRVLGIVRHEYRGALVVLRPLYLPPLRCTPDHRVYATRDPLQPPHLVAAKDLDSSDYLAVPRRFADPPATTLDVHALLADYSVTYRVPWRVAAELREPILMASAQGESSRAIGLRLGKQPSYIRHVRSKIARGLGGDTRTRGPVTSGGHTRFPGEHGRGIPSTLAVDADLAALLGYYCAEGCVTRSRVRPGSYTLNFAFSRRERALAERVQALLNKCLGVKAHIVERETTIGVAVGLVLR